MKKLIWEEKTDLFKSTRLEGRVGQLVLFTYCYNSFSRETEDLPYVFRILFSGKGRRFATEKQCKEHAEKLLKYIREQLL